MGRTIGTAPIPSASAASSANTVRRIDCIVIKNPADFIEGAAQVIEYYGYWATFHDAVLVNFSVVPKEEMITAVFQYDDMTDDESRSGSSLITLQWQGVLNYTLMADYAGGEVDALYCITFVGKENQIDTEIVKIGGISGKIQSQAVQVLDFKILP